MDIDNYRLPNIKLEHTNHFYYNTENLERFTSVTGVLSLIKEPFDGTSMIDNLVKSYDNFNEWYEKNTTSNNRETYLELIEKYYSFKNFRPYELKYNRNNEEYKAYRPLKTYKPLELYNELDQISKVETLKAPKLVYAKDYLVTMNHQEIDDLWKDVTYIANIYGSLVHTISETFFKVRGDEKDVNEVEAEARRLYDELLEFIPIKTQSWDTNTKTFLAYVIKDSYDRFKKHVIDSFLDLEPDLGKFCISERIMYAKEYLLAGMTDTLIHITDNLIDINDHKTNKIFSFESEHGSYLKAPFDKYEECDYILYSLQLSLYALMYQKEHNYKIDVRDMWISYYDRNKNSFERIDIKYMKDEARTLLEMHRNYTNLIETKWKKWSGLKDINPLYKRHLTSLLEKKANVYKGREMQRSEINKNLLMFVEDYKTWTI